MNIANIFFSSAASIAVGIISFFIQRYFLKKDQSKEGVPIIHIYTIQTPKALTQCRKSILEFQKLILIEKYDGEKLQFRTILFEEIEKIISENSIVFIYWDSTPNLHLNKIISRDNIFVNVDYNIVPQIQTGKNTFCFLCSESDKPSAFLATYKEQSIIYETRFISSGSTLPKFKKRKKAF